MFQRLFRNEEPAALMAQGRHADAVRRLRDDLDRDPSSVHLRKLLAEALVGAGERDEASALLHGLARELADGGFLVKAIAVLKRIQRLGPSEAIDDEIARLSASSRSPQAAPARPAEPSQPAETGAPPSPSWPTTEIVLAEVWAKDEDRLDNLRSSPLFSGLGGAELTDVIDGLHLSVKQPGAVIVSQGELGNALYLLVDGVARVYRREGTARARQVGVLQAGDFFGALAMLRDEPHGATVTAAGPCELLELDRDAFANLEARHPRLRAIVEQSAPSADADDEITVLALDSGGFFADTVEGDRNAG